MRIEVEVFGRESDGRTTRETGRVTFDSNELEDGDFEMDFRSAARKIRSEMGMDGLLVASFPKAAGIELTRPYGPNDEAGDERMTTFRIAVETLLNTEDLV